MANASGGARSAEWHQNRMKGMKNLTMASSEGESQTIVFEEYMMSRHTHLMYWTWVSGWKSRALRTNPSILKHLRVDDRFYGQVESAVV